MALYLGNQKVSLRSGQDPTFDYGFDSNGSLVFANKNATEINNFLNYDSSYSEILDLSNLSKMEKVAVNGTADRKMEGLKGILVSQNAPFTGSSPQINASYTGLNKNALVSLFESVPYNVGYEVVGNPTIVDGVVSGFSADDYILLPSVRIKSISELIIKIKLNPSALGQNVYTNFLMGPTSFQGFTYCATNYFAYSGFTVAGLGDLLINHNLQPNTDYWLKYTNDGTNCASWWSEDNVNYTVGTIKESSLITENNSGKIRVGSRLDRLAFPGSIDLNETYIKVNGVPWFTGKPAMTKTCSIVGATGTADLTQEDKNIILNKGWSLTVQ